ncbi:MAG: hypothetical protein EHM58_12350 [Ignavibacteriae bacterium]|nr:MAG: hypothetical protein EHM58_12350 [Ignavibacteriota bacterium]
MTKSKIFSIVAILIVFLSINILNAQSDDVKKTKKTPEERAKMVADRMQKKLELTDVQYQSIYDVLLTNFQQRAKDREQFQGEKKAFKKSQREKRKAAREQIKNILTDEQKAKMKELRKQNKMNKKKNKDGNVHPKNKQKKLK